MTTETDRLFDILRGNTFRADPNQIPQESIPAGGGNAQPVGWYGQHAHSSFIGQTNILDDPALQDLHLIDPIATTENTVGSWFVKYVLNSGTAPATNRYLSLLKARGNSLNPFNTHVGVLRSQAGAAYDIDYYVRTNGFSLSFPLAYLVAAVRVARLSSETWTNVTTATIVLEILNAATGAVLASSAALDWTTLALLESRQLVAPLPGAAGASSFQLRLHIHLVASAGGNDVLVPFAEPQLQFSYTPDPTPFVPLLGSWYPEGIKTMGAVGFAVTPMSVRSTGNTFDKFAISGSGIHTWGAGTATEDLRLRRSAAKILTIDDAAAGAATLALNGIFVETPVATQSITAAATAITALATHRPISSDAAYTLTAAPTIADGTDGQLLTLLNVGAFNITIQDQGTLASSNLRLTAATVTLTPRDSIELLYNATVGDWVQIGNLVAVL